MAKYAGTARLEVAKAAQAASWKSKSDLPDSLEEVVCKTDNRLIAVSAITLNLRAKRNSAWGFCQAT